MADRMFLSYRVRDNADVAEKMYDKLRVQSVDVWWDQKCLTPGEPWEDSFADGLFSAGVFVPLLSKAALAPFATLTPESGCDNVLLEYCLALELKERGELRAIFPVLIGDVEQCGGSLETGYGDFFRGGGVPQCPSVRVDSVAQKCRAHLLRAGKGAPLLDDWTVKGVLERIMQHQGTFLKGAPMGTAVENVVMAVAGVARPEVGSLASSMPQLRVQDPPDISDLSQSAGPMHPGPSRTQSINQRIPQLAV
jgi:hypothetical protein